MKSKSALVWTILAAMILAAGCEAADTTSSEDMDVAESEEALFSWVAKGPIDLNTNEKADLANGDWGHYYTYEAVAGEAVSFHVEWRLPAAKGLGAKLLLKNANGSKTLATVVEAGSNIAQLTYTFPTDGTYRIYVGQKGWSPFGPYPYVLSAFDHLCAQWEGTYDDAIWGRANFVLAENYEIGEPAERDPWSATLSNDPDLVVENHAVLLGLDCADLQVETCPAEGPEGGVGYGELIFGSAGVAANQCEVMNQVYEWAGEIGMSLVAYDDCANHPDFCELLSADPEE